MAIMSNRLVMKPSFAEMIGMASKPAPMAVPAMINAAPNKLPFLFMYCCI